MLSLYVPFIMAGQVVTNIRATCDVSLLYYFDMLILVHLDSPSVFPCVVLT
jgi:hypothetical protein